MMLLKENKLESFVREDKEEPKDDPKKSEWIEKNEGCEDNCRCCSRPHSTYCGKTYHSISYVAFIINNTSKKLALKR